MSLSFLARFMQSRLRGPDLPLVRRLYCHAEHSDTEFGSVFGILGVSSPRTYLLLMLCINRARKLSGIGLQPAPIPTAYTNLSWLRLCCSVLHPSIRFARRDVL